MKTIEAGSRIEIKNILFTTDFSPAGNSALPYANEFAKRFGAKLYALHVRPPAINPMTQPTTWPVLEEAAKAEAQEERRTLLKSFPGVQPEVLVEEGEFWGILKSTIEKNKIDLIVLGTRGRSGARKLFMGSTAEKIFRDVSCAVLTVGPFSHAELPRGGEVSEILYATDFGPGSANGAAYAVSLAQEFQARLTLLHVITEPKTGDLVHPSELVASSEHLLRKLVTPETELWCEPRFAVEQGSAAETILEVAKNRKADLIVLGLHRPSGFLGAATHLPMATAHKVVTHAPCPVLTVRG
ncbi:MAG: universal stress protein, partial [Candidatus Acidiferrales bacterium]|jgi:nucleotide-binding universal stress UspA family protein